MKFTARQLRAIGYCAKKYNQRLQLSGYPYVWFVRADTKEIMRVHIDDVLATYDTGRKADAKERAKDRRLQKKKA